MKKLILITAAALAAFSCIPDDRNNFMVDDSFGLTAPSVLQDASIHTGSFAVGIAKNGKGQSSASASISVAPEALANYNNDNGTSYKAVPADKYAIDATSLSFAKDDIVKNVNLSWDAAAMSSFIGNDKNYVIPLILSSSDETVKVKKNNIVLVHLVKTSVSVSKTSLTRRINKLKVEKGKNGKQPKLDEAISLDLVLDNAMKGVGIKIPVKIDNSLIPAYNAAQGKNYVAAPEGLVTLTDKTASVKESSQSGNFKLLFDKSLLLEDGKLKAFPDYVVPIVLDKEQLSATRYGKAQDLGGLDFGNLTTYFTITYEELKKGLYVSREWGLYSSSSSSWSAAISGFTADADRNVALDGENIYIAETNTTKNLWAISIADPSEYKKLPVETVNKTGTFYVACPRVIPNNDPKINDGKPILAVSNMTQTGDTGEAEPTSYLYVYDKGIDQNPTAIGLKMWAVRRIGDTFTYWGTWQKGFLLFKDMDSDAGTLSFEMAGGLPKRINLKWRLKAPAVTGAGGYYPFPDDLSKGMSSTRGGEQTWLTQSSKDLVSLPGNNADNGPALTAVSGMHDNTFRYVELGGKRYVVYTQQEGGFAGYLNIIEGATTDSWETIVQSGKIVYTAAIQNDTEQDALDTKNSPKKSGNSGMDIDVWTDEYGDILVAVVKQNVGLSLFKMTIIE